MVTHKDIGRCLQIEENMCHVNQNGLSQLAGLDVPHHVVSRDEGIELFNNAAKAAGLNELRDPKGYMALDDNVYEAIKDTYAEMYEDALQEIEDGYGYGTKHAVIGVLDKLDTNVRKNIKEHLPSGMNYGDLRFKRVTPEIQDAIDDFVEKRVEVTRIRSLGTIGRNVDKETFDDLVKDYHEMGNRLGEVLSGGSGGELVR